MVEPTVLKDSDLDNIITKLLAHKSSTKEVQVKLTEIEIRNLCRKAKDVIMEEPVLLKVKAPIKVVGDIHGQYVDLLRIFKMAGFPSDNPTGESRYLFLGDYVDRGNQSLEVICLLLAYKIKYPKHVYLLRGNHECASINRLYGFYDECKKRYNIKLWKEFTQVFNYLPVSAVIEDNIICMHGGLSPDLKKPEDVLKIKRPTDDVPDTGLLCDLLWSDPGDFPGFAHGERGISYKFGEKAISDFLKDNDLDLICRAHQVVEDGYEFFAKRRLVTIFSAPNYTGEYDNVAAVMEVSSDLECSFRILKPITEENK